MATVSAGRAASAREKYDVPHGIQLSRRPFLGLHLRLSGTGGAAVGALRRLCGLDFSGSASCQARARLPLSVLRRLLTDVTGRFRADDAGDPATRWRGRRVYLLDGSSFSMPDTPQLQAAFGQPG